MAKPHVSFNDDLYLQNHAWAWAANYYGESHADLFVAFILTLGDSEQEYVYFNGYRSLINEFENAYPDITLRRG